MKIKFVIEGINYSKNKKEFKKILKKHDLKWKGSINYPFWRNDNEKIKGEFKRDDEKDITISATLIWESDEKTPFFIEMEKWISNLDCEISEIIEDNNYKIKRKLEFWDKIHKPCIEFLKSTKRPEKWIEKDIERWRNERMQKVKELKKN